MKRWLIRFSLAFLALLLALFCAGWFLLGSQRGTDFVVSQVVKTLDGQLQIGMAEGRIVDRLQLTDVAFASPAGKIQVNRFVFAWKARELLRLHLHILEITAENVSCAMVPQETEKKPEPSAAPFSLPEITLPLQISLEKLGISDFRWDSSPDSRPVVVESATLSLLWDQSGLQVQNLSVTVPQGKLQGHGVLNPTGNYPLQIQTDMQALSEDLPSLAVHGEFSGDLQSLLVRMDVSGDITGKLEGTVKEVLSHLAWQGTVAVTTLRPVVFSPEIPGTVSGEIQTHGDLQQAAVTAAFTLRDAEARQMNWDAELDLQADLQSLVFSVKQLSLRHAETAAVLEVSGTASVNQDLDLVASWHDLQWPVTGVPEFAASRGGLVLKGRVDEYLLTLNTVLAGKQLPDGNWQLEAKGNTERAKIVQLRGNILEGSITLQGDVQWTPELTWKLSSDGKGINPAEFSIDWPGKFDWLLQTEGQVEEEGISGTVSLKQLQGKLRELPVAGSVNIALTPDTVDIHDLQLHSGTSRISAEGRLGDSSEINWRIAVMDFSDLLPNAGGTLVAKGVVMGMLREPQITAEVTANSVLIPQAGELQQLQADVDIDLSWKNPFHLHLSADGLQAGGNVLEQLQVNGEGTLADHKFAVSASHEMADVSLDLQGGYLQEQWQGLLSALEIDGIDVGNWQLLGPAAIAAGSTDATLAKMCLAREGADLCLDGSWNNEKKTTTAHVDLSGFALDWLYPWFPETLQNLNGLFSVQASVAMQEKIHADVTAEITPGSLTYRTNKEITGTLSHEGGKLNVHAADDAVSADFFLGVDGNSVKGTVDLPDILKVAKKGDAAVSAELFVDAGKFEIVEALVPEVQDLDAAVDFHFTVDGSIKEPDAKGKGTVNIVNILIPAAGLELKDTVLDITAADQAMHLNGTFHSPEGSLVFDGKAVLDKKQNWPLSATVKADMFRLINLPEAQIFMNSDLVLEKKADRTLLSGELGIPKAELLIRELAKGSVTVSPDVVIVQEQKEAVKEVKSPLEMDLRVNLGKAVHFVGFGLNAFIDGQLTVKAKPEAAMLGSGEFHIKQGTYRAYGQDLNIERGVISFPGGPLTQPGINLQATRTVGAVVAGINAIGPALKPRLTTFSKPPMSESATISYLLTGSAPQGGSGGVKLSIGRQINNKLSVSVGTDVKTGDSEFVTRYRLNRKIHVQTTTATNSNAIDMFYTVEVGGVDELVKGIVTEDLKIKVFD